MAAFVRTQAHYHQRKWRLSCPKKKRTQSSAGPAFYAQEHSDNPVITETHLREIEKKKESHIQAYYPGYLFFQDTFYVGTIKGLGRIYQQAGIDAYSNFDLVKVYSDKKAESAINFVKTKVLPVYQGFHVPLDRILTDNGKEYTTHWKNGRHTYEQ